MQKEVMFVLKSDAIFCHKEVYDMEVYMIDL